MFEDPKITARLLQQGYLFYGLEEDEIFDILEYFQTQNFERSTVLTREETQADCLYIILSGLVWIFHQRGDENRLIHKLGRGEFFGEEIYWFEHDNTSTAVTARHSTLLCLSVEAYAAVIEQYPKFGENLRVIAESRRIARRLDFKWLSKDEIVHFITRRHVFFLLTKMIFPAFIFLMSLLVIAFAIANLGQALIFDIAGSLGIFMLGAGLLFVIWNLLDWENDFFIVTNQRVVWVEKVIALHESRQEAPLDAVLSVNEFTSFWGRKFKFGGVEVRTYTHGIRMEGVNQPHLLATFVERYRFRAKEFDKEEYAQNVRQTIRRTIHTSDGPLFDVDYAPPPKDPTAKDPSKKQSKGPSMTLRESWNTLFMVRYESKDTITYRKHWWLLLKKIWLPILLLLGFLVLVSITVIPAVNALGSGLMIWMYNCGAGVMLLVIVGILIYQYLDWSNDIYRLTPEQILDIERRPLGEETKKTANLDVIQSIEHRRGNLIGILFNFGTVTVTVGETKFIFLGVHNPDQVHQDISAYRLALAERKEKKEQQKQQEAMKQWFISYYNRMQEMGGVFPPIVDEVDATEADLIQAIGPDYMGGDQEADDLDEEADYSDLEEPLEDTEEYFDEFADGEGGDEPEDE